MDCIVRGSMGVSTQRGVTGGGVAATVLTRSTCICPPPADRRTITHDQINLKVADFTRLRTPAL